MLKTVSSVTNAIGALNYKGTWNATTNTPTITSSVGVKGDYYQVSVAGSTTINGISNWGVGDVIAFNGTTWQRIEGGADLNGVNLSVSGTTTLSGLTASTALALNAGKDVVSVTNTGTGNNVLADGPTLTTPTLGAATATSVNKVAITAPANGSTLTIADGKTLTANNSIALTGTDATTMTFPTTSATIARTDAGQTFTGVQVMTSPQFITSINDTNGNELFGVTATTSAVNEFTVANAATGNAPTLSATGGDTNIGMALTPKGTGGVIFPAGAVGTPAITTSGDLNTGIFFPAADTIAFAEGGAEAVRIDSSGNVLVGITTARANAGDVQVSKGISFPATQSAQSDANTLDDYEEGTWTPTFAFSTSGSVTYTVQVGVYRKVGSLVYAQVGIVIDAVSSPTGNASISNLPFTSQDLSSSNFGFVLAIARDFQSDMPNLKVSGASNSTSLFFAKNATNAGQSLMQGSDLKAGTVLFMSGCYTTAT
jgi:hypothetical protein